MRLSLTGVLFFCGVSACALLCAASAANAAVNILGTQYRPDRVFPEHDCFWNASQFPGPCNPTNPGGSLHIYLQNTSASTVTVQDVRFVGFYLSDILRLHFQVVKRQPASIWLADLTAAQRQTLVDAGEPVWYKIDPATIAPGHTAQVIVRLRSTPVLPAVSLDIISSAGTLPVSIPVEIDGPQLASVGFSSDLIRVNLYWRRNGGIAPSTILMDGTDVTASTVTGADPELNLAVSVLELGQPLEPTSFHVFQGVYSDGRRANAGMRAWVNDFLYGTWGGEAAADGDDAAARAGLIEFMNHGLNTLIQNGSGVTSVLMKTTSGRQFVAEQGYQFVIDEVGKWSADNPAMWFIRDEPDWADYRLENIPENKKIGALGQMSLQRGEELRAANPSVPTTINVNAYSHPYCWYNYGQVPDVFMTDPYYQARLREAYWNYPTRIPLYEKATYIYAVAQVAQASCEPNPLHMVLYSCEWKDESGAVFPFPTPEAKRIEVYYGLAGGAKGFSYWWYLAGKPSNGLGAGGPAAEALWKAIGLLGNEIRTAAPLLVVSCPVELDVQSSPGVWVRSLAVGSDTLVLLAVNDQYRNDESGTHYTPVANASAAVDLPAWITSPSAFEISAAGTHAVATQMSGGRLELNLGTLDLTRMVVVTANPQLRNIIQQRYEQEVQDAVCSFAPEMCTQPVPPSITVQPVATTVCSGTNASFSVEASGPGSIVYQWQLNGVDLSDGNHYSGVTTSMLTIAPAEAEDAGVVRCVISNENGSVVSDEVALTVVTCSPTCLHNMGFEDGFTDGIGNGWTPFSVIGTVTFSAESTPEHVHDGSRSQRIYATNKDDGGLYQRFPATPGQPYTVKAWFKVHSLEREGNAEAFFGVDPTGGTDPHGSNVVWGSKPWEYWSQDSMTLVAQSTSVTFFLRGRSTRLAQSAYVWIDDLELAPGAPGSLAPVVLGPTSIQWRWTDLGIETGYRVRDAGGADRSGLLPPDTTQWPETTGLAPNTCYTRTVHAVNDCGESDAAVGRTGCTLSAPPEAGSLTFSVTSGQPTSTVEWTATVGFGAGSVQYYRYAWDQSPAHGWTGQEPQWSAGTLTTMATGDGNWYLHLKGFNSQDVSNGTYDYHVAVGRTVAPDLDCDGDVDEADFNLFLACLGGPEVPLSTGCEDRDFDGDGDADQSDFGILQRCYSGSYVPADPECDVE